MAATRLRTLILSSHDDAHAQAVDKHLQKLNVHVDFFRLEEFLQHFKTVFRLGGSSDVCRLQGADKTIDLRSYASIWHRRPGRIVPQQFPEPWVGKMVELEARHTIDGMFCAVDCVWVNHPRNDAQALQKLWQLELASEIGLTIPETLVTNDPDMVRGFFSECDGEVIYKLIGETTNFSIPAHEQPRGISTLPLRVADLDHLEQVRFAPHLFQRRVKKRSELRVTIVGHKTFAIEIDSQSGAGKVDWRNDYSVDMKAYTLPEQVEEQCKTLMRRMGLNYGALDFCLTPQGEYVFLEINCAGQYLWMEERANLPISAELALLLAGKSEPLVSRDTQ